MQLGGLHWSWRVSGEAEDTFATPKREQALVVGGEVDEGEDEVRGRDAIIEDP
jgi:hypothetical protein